MIDIMKRAIERIGGLSAVSKMPCYSWGLSAWACKTGSVLADNAQDSPCARCYARRGFYHMPAAKSSLQRRMDVLTKSLSNPLDRRGFIHAFQAVLNYRLENTLEHIERHGVPPKRDGRYFRWFDSGDLQSVDHLRLISMIAMLTPGVIHWLPTQESEFVDEFVATAGYWGGSYGVPKNLIIRVSSTKINKPQYRCSKARELAPNNIKYSYIDTHHATCPADAQGHKCLDCRDCWDPNVEIVSYNEI